MPTYYVKPAAQGGNNGLAGTSPSTAWATVAYALSSSSGFTSGDTLFIAPGVYTNTISVTMANPTVETNIIGDPTASQFSGFTAGPVVITNYNSSLSGSGYTGNLITATTKNFLHFQNIKFAIDNNRLLLTTCTNWKFTKCSFVSRVNNTDIIVLTSPTSTAVNLTVNKCVFVGGYQSLSITGQNVADGSTIIDSIFISPSNTAMFLNSVQVAVYNCVITGTQYGVLQQPGSLTFPTTVRNSLLYKNLVDLLCVTVNNAIVENYNRLLSPTPRNNVADNLTSSSVGDIGIDFFESLLWGQNNLQPFTSYASSPNASFGNATGAPAADIYGVTWTGTSPDAGAGTYRVITSIPSNVGYVANLPVNTQASVITIAPGSTSQSIELYLGATGLTASTSGLSARYNRTRTASVGIPLVARTIAQAWTSGGFAEVDATNMPGVYRLDLPDAALAAGADDVTVVVRGASGTNGAVMTVKLSSGGLTSAQTASAVLDAVGSSYVTAGSIGYAIQNSNVASISGSTAAADELEGALLHNGTDYISAQLIAGGGGGAGDVGGNIINLNEDPEVIVQTSAWVGDWHTYVLRLVDSNGTPYDITNDTLAVTYTNIATGSAYAFGGGSATITKQMNGQGIVSILNPAAYATAAVIRLTVSATIGTTVRRFGPLEIEVLAP